MNLIRGFLINPLAEIKLKGTISRVKMLAISINNNLDLIGGKQKAPHGVIYIILSGNTRLSTENT